MGRAKTPKKTKTRKALEAEVVKLLPSQEAFETWFGNRPSSSQAEDSTPEPSNVAQVPIPFEDMETQDPTMGAEASQDDVNNNVGKRKRPRGPNIPLPTPTNPNDRKMIGTLYDEKFSDPKIVRTITKSIQLNFSNAWATWKRIPGASKEQMWAVFQEKFQWPIEKESIVRMIWEITCKEWLRGMLEEERTRAMKHFGVDDIDKCKGYKEGWIRADIWDRLVTNVWSTSSWKNKSITNKQNRKTEKEGSITKHTGGSIPFMIHAERMAKELNLKPSYIEVFDRTHKREKGHGDFVDNKSKSVSETYNSSMSQKYGPDQTDHPEFDLGAWCEAIGGLDSCRTHIYGFGITPRGKNVFSTSNDAGSASWSACSPAAEARPAIPPTEVENLREEVISVKDNLLNLQQDNAEIKKYLAQLTEFLNPNNMLPQCSVGPSQPTESPADQAKHTSEP